MGAFFDWKSCELGESGKVASLHSSKLGDLHVKAPADGRCDRDR